jgi:hypothetical protein
LAANAIMCVERMSAEKTTMIEPTIRSSSVAASRASFWMNDAGGCSIHQIVELIARRISSAINAPASVMVTVPSW